MTLNDFITTYTGQSVDVDGVTADTGQCVQLVALYCQKVLDVPFPNANAKDWWNNPIVLENFVQLPVGQEQNGDIAVWGASSLINSPDYGHIDIVVSPGFMGFDSNWGNVMGPSGYPAAHKVQHNYTDVLGFLRVKGGSMEGMITTADDVAELTRFGFFREPTQDEINEMQGKYWIDAVRYFRQSGAGVAVKAQYEAGGNTKATKLSPGLYQV